MPHSKWSLKYMLNWKTARYFPRSIYSHLSLSSSPSLRDFHELFHPNYWPAAIWLGLAKRWLWQDIDGWVKEEANSNKPSHFLPALVLPVVAFCYPLLGHPTSTALALSGGRKTIPFSCRFKPKSATSISPLLLIPCCSVIPPSVLQPCPTLCKKFINQSPCKPIWVYHLLPVGTLTGTMTEHNYYCTPHTSHSYWGAQVVEGWRDSLLCFVAEVVVGEHMISLLK